jgi:hypothetical protein
VRWIVKSKERRRGYIKKGSLGVFFDCSDYSGWGKRLSLDQRTLLDSVSGAVDQEGKNLMS